MKNKEGGYSMAEAKTEKPKAAAKPATKPKAEKPKAEKPKAETPQPKKHNPNLERIFCNGCKNCKVERVQGLIIATCKDGCELATVRRQGMAYFVRLDEKCKNYH